jgi:polysaccharide biosynthesis protein PslG
VQQDQEFGVLEQMGVRWVRVAIPWSAIEGKGAGLFNWTKLDGLVASANTHHLKLIAEVGHAPAWANPGLPATQSYDFSQDPMLYAQFLGVLAARYVPAGVMVYELGNEPNHVKPSNPNPDPLYYTHLLCDTYPIVKAVNANDVVLTGGLGGTTNGGGDYSGPTFVADLYTDGAGGCFDAISYHPYTYPQLPPGDSSSGWTGMLTVRQTMVANGDANKQIWVTEYGAPTNGPSSSRYVTETVQAQMVTTAYQLFNTYSWAGPLCWFQYQDQGTDPTIQDDWFGLYRYDGTAKPAATTYTTIAHQAT